MKKLIVTFLAVWITASASADVIWFDGQQPVTYELPKKVEPVVLTALEMWKGDMWQVTGFVPVAAKKATISIKHNAKLPTDAFRLYTRSGRIIIEGGNGRGIAYGLLELSRLAGVSPWIWWGDIVPERKERLMLDDGFHTEQRPSVELRGIFLNDEDWSLRPWSSKTYEPSEEGQIGPRTYRRIFELLLRLRANAVWPAMHGGTKAFFQTTGAKAVADSCGIVIGTSHCEPLLRNNVGEWDVSQRGRFNYRDNRQAVQQYWTERLQEVSQSQNNMFTIGMRGIHDSSMEGYQTEQEKLEGLQQVIDDQQQLLRQYIGKPEHLTQVFVPYKEVLQLYENGLQVPDYVTLLWCDDNYGYMTRLSNQREQQRSGGAGIYYHLSYWGRPHDYLWLTTTQPGLIYHELRQSYDHHARRLWIANVHDPKVAGYDLELFLDMAWNIDCVTGQTLTDHLQRWLCRQFGEQAGQRLLPVMHEFYRLCGERRPEFMGWTQVELDKKKYHRGLSLVDTVAMDARQATERLAAFRHIKDEVASCRMYVRPELADAFFAAIEYPVLATEAMNRKILSDSAESHRAYEEIQALTRRYNAMRDGKWRGLMDAAPRKLPVFEDVNARLSSARPNMVANGNACDYEYASTGVTKIQLLGRSMNAVAMSEGDTLTFQFEVSRTGDYVLATALIPTHPINSGDLRFSISIDGGTPIVYSLKEPFRSERWKQNVLSGKTERETAVHLTAGKHRFVIRALDDNIVMDSWQLR